MTQSIKQAGIRERAWALLVFGEAWETATYDPNRDVVICNGVGSEVGAEGSETYERLNEKGYSSEKLDRILAV